MTIKHLDEIENQLLLSHGTYYETLRNNKGSIENYTTIISEQKASWQTILYSVHRVRDSFAE